MKITIEHENTKFTFEDSLNLSQENIVKYGYASDHIKKVMDAAFDKIIKITTARENKKK